MNPTPETVSGMKSFALIRWRERASENGMPEPVDLSGACKFCALFALNVFGGRIEAHEFHTWIVVDGHVVDLAEDSRDVADMRRGETPESCLEYARIWNVEWEGSSPYEDDPPFRESVDFRESIASCEPRAMRWSEEWKAKGAAAPPR